MGALHAGHMALVHEAKRVANHVVVSIFVNPKQFGPNEDLDSYPKQEAADAAMLADQGAAILWAPAVATMYPRGHAAQISVAGLDTMLCGAARPGHFDGVATVVAKLFNQVQPDVALFGEKDWQQLVIIRRMARDLDFDLEIIGVPTVREADGLALSSRNAYLLVDDRKAAAILPQAMRGAVAAMAEGANVATILSEARAAILSAGFSSVDYLELRDGTTLALLNDARPGARLFAAARIGTTRLIDNIPAA
jgi:pantoate--beta-alanine ligase